MKKIAILAAFAALVISGCGPKDEGASIDTPGTTTSTTGGSTSTDNGGGATLVAKSYDVGSKKVGDKAVCAICMINEGKETDEEDVKATLDYEGKTYAFCEEAEKATFISDPKKYTGGK